jgi:hypothetical protein
MPACAGMTLMGGVVAINVIARSEATKQSSSSFVAVDGFAIARNDDA